MKKDVKADIKKIIGGRIRARRQKLGISQEDTARKVKMYQANLSRIEKGEIAPNMATLEKLSKALECSVADFVKE